MGIELKDDATVTGGIDHIGETVQEFIESVGISPVSIEELNEALQECGICKVSQ
ncbi:hypothetical protein ACLUYE_05880 [Limosilactobacillus reuteri subsp. suis]|uniref:hypothetical protein n=1 Tax=Limosilactobacillus reuteri TaxID=1598 RepID=UPI003996BE99